MQARRAARELAFILFSQIDKDINNYSKADFSNIVLKSVKNEEEVKQILFLIKT